MIPAHLRSTCIAIAISQIVGLCVADAQAAVITVDSHTDEGTGCTLREAIDSANAGSATINNDCPPGVFGKDEIIFSTQLSERTLTLTNGALVVSEELEITGFADGSLVIDANGNSRVLQTVSGTNELVLNSVTLRGGSTNDVGGGIYAESVLTINQSTITGNTANDGGGGIYTKSPALLKESTVSNNMVLSDMFGKGGGIYETSQFDVTLIDSTITGNSAALGGGIYTKSYFSDQGLKVQNSEIENNYARLYGGGVYTRYAGVVNLESSSLNQNTSGFSGGGLFIKGTTDLNINNSEVDRNLAGYTSGSRGGGLWINNSHVVIDSSTISNNIASDGSGGGIYQRSFLTLDIINSTISGNTAGFGGAFAVRYGVNVETLFSTIVNNKATSSIGTGLRIENDSTVNLQNSVVAGNTPAEINVYSAMLSSSGINFIGTNSLTTAEAITGTGASVGENDLTGTSDGTHPSSLNQLIRLNLDNNGGLTKTHNLLSNSPLANAADSSECGPESSFLVDQRGRERDAMCDLGSVEFIEETSCFVVPASNSKVLSFCL